MPDNLETASSETAVANEPATPIESADNYSNLFSSIIRELRYFAKLIYVEQRLPALILTIIVVALAIVSLSNPFTQLTLFLWIIIIPPILGVICFVLPKQAQKFQEFEQTKKALNEENTRLRDQASNSVEKLQQVRDSLSEIAANSLNHFTYIESGLEDVKSQVGEFLNPENPVSTDAYIKELDQAIADLLEYVRLRRHEIDNLPIRIRGAESVFESKSEAASFMAKIHREQNES